MRASDIWLAAALVLGAPAPGRTEGPYAIVLGIAQDGGVPQAGSRDHPGWSDAAARRRVACLGLVDPGAAQRWLLDATPELPAQLHALDTLAAVAARPGLSGIFLTHGHMGHYTGLLYLGHEAMGARDVPVYAMPRLLEFLSTNGPWSQLVQRRNVVLQPLREGHVVRLNERLQLVPFRVPHRQEYSEVVGFRVSGARRALLYLPDIDSWSELDSMGVHIEDLIAAVDVAYLDGTFYADGEVPGRDMSGFPHPFITRSMERFEALPAVERGKVRFIHLNHTNPALQHDGEARRAIEARGFHVADELERVEL